MANSRDMSQPACIPRHLDVVVSGSPCLDVSAEEINDMMAENSPTRDRRFLGRELILKNDDGRGNVIVLTVRGEIGTRYWL